MKHHAVSTLWLVSLMSVGVLSFSSVHADVDECSTLLPPLDIPEPPGAPATDIIDVTVSETITDVRVQVEVTHGFIGDVQLSIASPGGTEVTLHEDLGGSDANIVMTYTDEGIANGAIPYDGDCFMQPSGPGTLSDFEGENTMGEWVLTVFDGNDLGSPGTLDSWCLQTFELAEPPPPIPVENLGCTSLGGTGVADVSWTNPVPYDEINIFINGVMETTLPGTATSYSTPPQPFPDVIEICVEGVIGGIPNCVTECCNVSLQLLPADLEICQTVNVVIPFPGPPVPDTITVVDDQPVGDVQISVDITHSFVGDLTIDIEHNGTSVRLHNENGGAAEDFLVTYWDFGQPNQAPYDCGCLMQPSGPGVLADLAGGSTLGDWTLTVEDVFTGAHPNGNFNSWCLRTFQAASIVNLECTTISASGVADLTWENTSTYDGINIYVGGALETTLPGDATSYSTLPVAVPASIEVCVEPTLGAITYPQVCCDIDLLVFPVLNLDCTSTSGTGIVNATWENPPGGFDEIVVLVNGSPEATLPGTATSYDTLPLATPDTAEVGVQGTLAGFLADTVNCLVPVLPTADVEGCSSPAAPITQATPVSDVINIGPSTIIGDVEILVDITHTWIGDMNIDVTSPGGTTVRLHAEDLGADADNIFVVYNDNGIANGIPYDCACFMQPSGPGALGDFIGELSNGDWTLDIEDTFPGDDGTLDQWCVRITSGCQILPPSGLICSASGDDAVLDWVNNDAYDSIDIVRDGSIIDNIPGGVNNYVDLSPPAGTHTYEVVGNSTALGCGNASNSCFMALGITDVVFRGEVADGLVDSAAALQASLEANGSVVLVVDELTSASVNFGGTPEVLWLCLGTFPNEHDLSAAEGILLSELVTGDIGLDGTIDQPGLPIYIEGADVWGFATQTTFEDYDGVENQSFGNIDDGDDSLVDLLALDSGLGLDTTGLDAIYTQDSTGDDFTDRLVPCDVNPDLGGNASAAIWFSDDGFGNTYFIGTYYLSTFSPVIASSFEFGGHGGDIVALAALYRDALLDPNPPPPMDEFKRGDSDGDGIFNGLVDALYTLAFQFSGGPPPPCLDAADADDDGTFNGLVDALFTLAFQFSGGPPPPPPGPNECGQDPTPDGVDCLTPLPPALCL